MPMLNAIKRRLIEQLSTLVNELHIGSDGTIASVDDGGVRSLATVSPTLTVLDDTSLLIEGTFDASHIYSADVQEVYLQYRDATTGEFVPVYRTAIPAFTKNGQNEVRFSFILEVE
tara:strand:+ start:1150 stop:1497 length:348 start_codon:yes stop_codon:yes gene_type:complete